MGDTIPQFPLELLDAPPETRKMYFRNKVVAHPSIVQAHTLLMSALRHPIDGQIVMVIGAPGGLIRGVGARIRENRSHRRR